MYRLRIWMFLLIVSLFPMMHHSASATSWVDLKPQEVLQRAEVIVQGTYDFTSEKQKGKLIWTGYKFNITKTYKGNVSEKITAGIDVMDVGWVDEFQKQDGEFLLFLEQGENAAFLTPVAGPNGMITLKDGKVVNTNEQETKFFEDFISTTVPTTGNSQAPANQDPPPAPRSCRPAYFPITMNDCSDQ